MGQARYITLRNNIVMAVRYGPAIAAGEIESVLGEIGQVYDPIGKTFSTPIVAVKPEIVVADVLKEISDRYAESAVLLDKIKKKLGIT